MGVNASAVANVGGCYSRVFAATGVHSLVKKQKATALRNDLLNLFLDGKKKKLTDIGLVFLRILIGTGLSVDIGWIDITINQLLIQTYNVVH
jgi:hypothetical protein